VALMPCNPSIGGPAKGHLVRELDALGGQMGISADLACIQMRLLNTGKGYAVHALRGQEDKPFYHTLMKKIVEDQENLELKQLMIDKLLVENGAVVGVEAETGEVFEAKCVILATGTYLRGRIVYGQVNYECGPNGLRSAQKLSASLLENGVELMRFKTGTPARIDARSLDYSKMEPQYGDEEVRNFSFISDIKTREQVPCYLTYTNEATHKIIRDNLHLSGMYNGMIEGVGPRYCPSIESKIVRFANKERHQLFIEPEGRSTNEMYVQGMSSSLPAHIQLQFMQTIPGLEHCKMMRAGYAIDYDCLDPLQLRPSLEHKAISGLFSAGQSNGTSGYEEAAAQGLMAGINAMMKINGREPLVLRRDEAYIGVLIDDLVTKGTSEPYRMMTSRAEYRLLLRQDNADLRLTEKGRAIGLVDDKRYGIFTEKRTALERTVSELDKQNISPSAENNAKLEAMGTAPLRSGSSLLDLLRRKEVTYSKLQQAFDLPELAPQVAEQAEIFAKYEGYITKQRQEVERFMKLENKRLPDDIDYRAIKELSSEAAEKLDKVRPANIGQASRISGVSPADISVLMIALELKRRKEQEE
jgi:tRNA uridine 5-carboxymethylaminomethyl modification enzyme